MDFTERGKVAISPPRYEEGSKANEPRPHRPSIYTKDAKLRDFMDILTKTLSGYAETIFKAFALER